MKPMAKPAAPAKPEKAAEKPKAVAPAARKGNGFALNMTNGQDRTDTEFQQY
jgi:hypothetical protein